MVEILLFLFVGVRFLNVCVLGFQFHVVAYVTPATNIKRMPSMTEVQEQGIFIPYSSNEPTHYEWYSL